MREPAPAPGAGSASAPGAAAASGAATASTAAAAPSAPPVETRPANAPDQAPAFAGQTRAPLASTGVIYRVQTVARGLEHPWALAFLPDGTMLVTERPGRLRVVASDGSLSKPLSGLPAVDARDQGGLLDLAVSPSFAADSRIYWSYAEPRDGGNGTAVARGRLDLAAGAVRDVEVIWRMTPTLDSTLHFGSRLVFGRDGKLFVTTGERSITAGRVQAQRLDSSFGKVVRIEPAGGPVADNPFVGRAGAQPEIWSSGHRNIQSAALHPETGALWEVEHGARGGDELNIVEAGQDYGWPTITYGVEYGGGPIGDGITSRAGLQQPRYYWDPVIAPSGMAFYTGALFPSWRGSLLVGSLGGRHIARLTLDGDKVIGEERLVTDQGRIRDVRVGPDGAVYALTDAGNGALLRIVPG